MTDHAMSHREPISAVALRLPPYDPGAPADTATAHDWTVTAVVTSALTDDGTAVAAPVVDVRAPTAGPDVDQDGACHLPADAALALADALRDAARTAQQRAER